MKRIRYLLLGLAVLAFAGSQAQNSGAGSSMKPVDTAHFYMKHSYDVLKYHLYVDLYHCYPNPFSTAFPATELITFKVDSALNSIRLNAVNTSLQIDSVGLAGISFFHASDTLTIQLDHTYQPGNVVSVKISYQHKNVADHAVYSNGGFVFTDTPPEGARKWFPCWDRPSDKALLDLTAKVPLNVKLGSNGSLADSLIEGDTIYYHWISRDPIATYLMTMISKTNFALDIVYWHKLYHPADSIPVRFYFQSLQIPDSIEAVIRPMADFYSSLFGEYPFEKIGFATLNGSFPWGGMENQTMISLTTNGWHEGLICHEFSHQWFGDLITCGTWADIWLNESFGTYCESLWLEHKGGNSAYKSHLDQQSNYYLANNPGFAIYNPSWAIHTPAANLLYNPAVVYDKGACVLHQLRYVIGDSAFFHLLNAYATDTNFIFKNAVTSDFIAKANEISGTDLDWFFDEWLCQPNHPIYSNSYEIQDLGAGKWNLKLLLSQTQTNTVFFKMPVQVRLIFTDSTDTMICVMHDTNHQFFEFVFSKQPAYLVFDPYRNILLKKATTTLGIANLPDNTGFRLFQNEPNPFKITTTIKYQLQKPSFVRIMVMDSFGREVLPEYTRQNDAGIFNYTITGKNLSPGFYFYKMESGNFNETRRMILTE
jgi:aminopeptidase N